MSLSFVLLLFLWQIVEDNNTNNNINNVCHSFVLTPTLKRLTKSSSDASSFSTRLFGGNGVAIGYTWFEDAFDIEIKVEVPRQTRAKDITFKATSKSIELTLNKADGTKKVLLDPARKLRGRVVVDGTFWEIGDPDDHVADFRYVTVTLEKYLSPHNDEFEVVEYDWNGVYSSEYDDEIVTKKYDEPEDFDVKEYAASLGVDIDNMNMSMVDKSMFTSGVNATIESLEKLKSHGFVKEVTQQGDGSEWVDDDSEDDDDDDDDDNENSLDKGPVPFSPLGETVTKSEWQQATAPKRRRSRSIPFLDTDSPWHKAVPVNETSTFREEKVSPEAMKKGELRVKKLKLDKERKAKALDPIDTLTVSKLKDLLRQEGLKVSGNKKELQDRLRSHIQATAKATASSSSTTTTTSSSGKATANPLETAPNDDKV